MWVLLPGCYLLLPGSKEVCAVIAVLSDILLLGLQIEGVVPVVGVALLAGGYNPLTNPATVTLDAEKVNKWLANGAQPTVTVKNILEANNIKTTK